VVMSALVIGTVRLTWYGFHRAGTLEPSEARAVLAPFILSYSVAIFIWGLGLALAALVLHLSDSYVPSLGRTLVAVISSAVVLVLVGVLGSGCLIALGGLAIVPALWLAAVCASVAALYFAFGAYGGLIVDESF